jgi:cell filamentation protein
MRDPYLWPDADVLRNSLGIKDAERLEAAEADIAAVKLLTVDGAVAALPFDFSRLLAIHKHVFGDLFEWAGSVGTIPIVKGERILGGDTVRYSPPGGIQRDAERILREMNGTDWSVLDIHETAEKFAKLTAALWQAHPFREGNTRTAITFAAQFAEARGFRMDKSLLKERAAYVRDALAKGSDGQYSEYEYLVKIFRDAILRG